MICQESTNVHVCEHVFWNSGSNHQNVDHVQKKNQEFFNPLVMDSLVTQVLLFDMLLLF